MGGARGRVQGGGRRIPAALRHRTFFSLAELNAAIAELVQRLIIQLPRRFAPTSDHFAPESLITFPPESVITFTGMRTLR